MNFDKETGITEEELIDDDLDDIDTSIFDKIRCIPDFTDTGVQHFSTCTCGGKITSIRSTYNAHLHASCDKCGFELHQ